MCVCVCCVKRKPLTLNPQIKVQTLDQNPESQVGGRACLQVLILRSMAPSQGSPHLEFRVQTQPLNLNRGI